MRTKPTEQTSPAQFQKENPYSNDVLVGNWFEERFQSIIDRHAIAPAISGESKCFQNDSLYKSDFKQPIFKADREACEGFIKWKQQYYSNRLATQYKNIKMWDSDQFAENLTTFKDVFFEIMPRQEKGKSTEVRLAHRKVNDDYMRSFGNSTKTGLLRWLECEKKQESKRRSDMSHYKNNFQPIKITKRITLHKGPRRKTSII